MHIELPLPLGDVTHQNIPYALPNETNHPEGAETGDQAIFLYAFDKSTGAGRLGQALRRQIRKLRSKVVESSELADRVVVNVDAINRAEVELVINQFSNRNLVLLGNRESMEYVESLELPKSWRTFVKPLLPVHLRQLLFYPHVESWPRTRTKGEQAVESKADNRGDPPAHTRSSRPPSRPVGRGGRTCSRNSNEIKLPAVLVVEDNPINRKILCGYLRRKVRKRLLTCLCRSRHSNRLRLPSFPGGRYFRSRRRSRSCSSVQGARPALCR